MEIAKIIFSENLEKIKNTIDTSFVNNVPSEYLEFTIEINLIVLCDAHPVLVNQMVRDFLPCKEAITNLVKEEIKRKYTKENVEYTQLVNFKELFDVQIKTKNVPVLCLKSKIKNIHELLQPKYSIKQTNENIFDDDPVFEVVSNVTIPLITFKGILTEITSEIKTKSNFFLCVNKNCHDRTYVLKLKNISYNFMDSKKSFTCSSDTLTSTCCNCKTQLDELIKKRKSKRTYFYVLSDTNFNLICESEKSYDETKNEIYLTGHLFRREKGQIAFLISNYFFVEFEDELNFKISNIEINQNDKLSIDLMRLTSVYFYDFKCVCSKEDVLLFIIINILNLTDKKILLMTSDPVYAFRCCKNILKNSKNKKISFCSFKEETGICIRDYNEMINKKKDIKFDFTFNLTINNLLDYKYSEPEQNQQPAIILQSTNNRLITNTIYSSQTAYPNYPVNTFPNYESVQILFLEFREFYKGKIEPERLLDSLLYLYKSIENIMQGEKEEQYAGFIRNNFKGKLI
ncbi:hypothetical protein NBO_507g0013 [Nosema bombycis CQ1]|uniref:Uncharacterized protein n=1 Tax=Nosema bombycis (strain CQ1 / CVCC 102059) TaxID=578461 RepID=R0MHC4_NOSB1|nr:hypothetical protein NBO_507g0013 [Nosema bombycis CQ1]|eukprot:EOB12198.1 hypothetical protein NBO_507g0013 [Nosema bombycis CQ1]